jgi:hypothetical protein
VSFEELFDLVVERSGSSYLIHFRLSDAFKSQMGDGITSYQLTFDYDSASVSDVAITNAALVNIGNLTSGRVEFGGYGIEPFSPGESNTQLVTLGFTTDAATVSVSNLSVELCDANWNETFEQFSEPHVLELLVPPSITSDSSVSVDEGVAAGRAVYTATASDDLSGLSFSLKPDLTDDAASFEIDSSTGFVTLTGVPDYETKTSYTFTVVVTDSDGLTAEQLITLSVNNLDEAAPTITSGATAIALDENSQSSQVVYTATAVDDADISGGVTFSIKPENADDAALVAIDSSSGAVTLREAPDYETKSSYSFTVVATDAAGNASEKNVSLSINNLDEVAPTFTSSTSVDVNENVGGNTLIYTASATDDADISGGVSFSLKSSDSDDSSLLSIDAATGEVILSDDPDYETKSEYRFTVVVTDVAGWSSEQQITLNVVNLDEAAPTFIAETATASVDEETGADQVIYTALADDTGDISSGIIYALKSGISDNADLFSIDASTGEVSLLIDPDYETNSALTFTVVVTDGAGFSAEQAVTLNINDLPELPSVYVWNTHQLFETVTKTQDGAINVALTDLELGRVISASDALAALKIAVGLNPNRPDAVTGEPGYLSPFQLLAADVNQDGRVSAADALNVLKMAVNLDDAYDRDWILVAEDAPLWDTDNERALVTRTSIDWDAIQNATDSAGGATKLVAVLKGDVNASWQGAETLETLADDYFSGDTFKGAGAVEQWWVV